MPEKKVIGLNPLRFLIGKWEGHGEGFGQKSEVEHSYQFVLQDQFIQSQTTSIVRGEDGTTEEIHEDLGIFSFDSARKKIIFRAFYSEGYINEYVMEEGTQAENQIILTTEKAENAGGMMARLRTEIISENEYVMTLDLANKGGEFKPCQVIRMRKVS
ncbi:MAG TPA: heme-binding beta-barrel domain-containing protein [Anaerolineales bacterium]|nr:heme-binding beta-barrel domain-containing protein [Anaerolineales bacterium]